MKWLKCVRMGMRGETYKILVGKRKYATSKMVD